MTIAERVDCELMRILDHSGLNADETVTVSTTVQARRCRSRIQGVNLHGAVQAFRAHLDDRHGLSIWMVDDSVIIEQRARE
jgi:hypothetical protein